MAVQIFGTSKSFETKKAERYFSERRIPVQVVDLKEKGISAGELESVITSLAKRAGGRQEAVELLADTHHNDYASFAYLDDSEKVEKLLANPQFLAQPIVRNGKTDASVGFKPDIWKDWK